MTMMIRPPLSAPLRYSTPADGGSTDAAVVVPNWLRASLTDGRRLAALDIAEVAVIAGAAIGALDMIVRRQERWAGAWRQRLAVAAGEATARQSGRAEDEAALRDAVLLARPGDDVGPGGRMYLVWRRLAAWRVNEQSTGKAFAAVLEAFGHVRNDETAGDLAGESLGIGGETVGTLTRAFAAADRHGFGYPLGCWLADLSLARRLGWTHAIPLLGIMAPHGGSAARPRRTSAMIAARGAGEGTDLAKSLLATQARAALRAIDLSAELGRRAERLLAVAPTLRAKGASAVVDRLLGEDALVASREGSRQAGMSDRGMRRLFDRLVELGAVRELSGRPTFRTYGL